MEPGDQRCFGLCTDPSLVPDLQVMATALEAEAEAEAEADADADADADALVAAADGC